MVRVNNDVSRVLVGRNIYYGPIWKDENGELVILYRNIRYRVFFSTVNDCWIAYV
jgi:hypothetical protein